MSKQQRVKSEENQILAHVEYLVGDGVKKTVADLDMAVKQDVRRECEGNVEMQMTKVLQKYLIKHFGLHGDISK